MGEKIGILLPKSDMYPTLALDFMNGFKLSIGQSDWNRDEPDLKVEGIGSAGGETSLRAAERMVLQENVDLTLSFCGIHSLEYLTGFFNAYKRPLIHIDLGGNLLKEVHRSPYVVHHSLNLCQASYSAGRYAAEKLGKKGALAASFYDGGYHLSYSFVRGYTDHGGEIVYNYVGPMDYKQESYETMVQGLEEHMPEMVFTLFSYKEGAKVCKILASSSLNGKMKFVAIPTMTDEYYNKENYQLDNTISVASWSFDEEQPAMQNFLKAYRKEYAELPNIFGMLGYEAGLLIASCLEETGSITNEIGNYLKDKTINTPRGLLKFNSYYDSFISDLKVRSFQYNQSKYHNKVIDNLESASPEILYRETEELPHSGWQNPYICT